MITYVNTVLVGTGAGIVTAAPAKADKKNTPSTDAGKFVVMNMDDVTNPYATLDETNKKFRIGFVTSKNTVLRKKDGTVEYLPIIKWSNPIKRADITSVKVQNHFESKEDTITIDFANVKKVASSLITEFSKGDRRIIVRLTFKDMPTRYRKWTESYEYITKIGDTETTIAEGIAKQINKEYKRARVVASASAGIITLTAMPYDDDDMNDSLNWANKVRFSANVYYTDPTAPAFASKNKYSIQGLKIKKTPGVWCSTDGKLVRDRESQAMGYQGILNRGECTWPIIKPDMVTDITKDYDGLTIMFENHYHAADDQIRQTKECVEVYDITDRSHTNITNLLTAIGITIDDNKIDGQKMNEEIPVNTEEVVY